VTRVLFIHGLESGPNGNKPRALRDVGLEVTALQMPCGREAIMRDPVTVATLGAAGGALALALRRGVLPLALGVAGLALAKPLAMALATRRAFARSVAVQLRALAQGPAFDVVVGSSFGGAVALELLHRGAWRGPTVLLCPAHERVAERAWRAPSPGLAALSEVAGGVVVVHGRADEIVPIEHSRRLVHGSRAELVEVEDDHRLTKTATSAALRSWIERAQAAQLGLVVPTK
jgi:pimeloyl-ACP methyl ester carboxylesterase